MTSTGRINYIDELKGFILCLVCLGHIAYSELSYVMNWMSLMRMFTFFFLSGLLFSRRRFPTFKDYAISKTKHLLFPYIWLFVFYGSYNKGLSDLKHGDAVNALRDLSQIVQLDGF